MKYTVDNTIQYIPLNTHDNFILVLNVIPINPIFFIICTEQQTKEKDQWKSLNEPIEITIRSIKNEKKRYHFACYASIPTDIELEMKYTILPNVLSKDEQKKYDIQELKTEQKTYIDHITSKHKKTNIQEISMNNESNIPSTTTGNIVNKENKKNNSMFSSKYYYLIIILGILIIFIFKFQKTSTSYTPIYI